MMRAMRDRTAIWKLSNFCWKKAPLSIKETKKKIKLLFALLVKYAFFISFFLFNIQTSFYIENRKDICKLSGSSQKKVPMLMYLMRNAAALYTMLVKYDLFCFCFSAWFDQCQFA